MVDVFLPACDALAPYLFLACRRHAARLPLALLPHAFSALASFWARLDDLEVTFLASAAGVTLPAPEKVSLEGDPNSVGCGVGPGLQASPVVQGGGVNGGGGAHGSAAVHSCASYMSMLVS